MFSVALLLGLSTLALGLDTRDLKVFVNALSGKVSSIEDIIISAVVSNPTNKDIRVFAKSNVLDNTATGSFAIFEPVFNRRKPPRLRSNVSRPPAIYLHLPYTTLKHTEWGSLPSHLTLSSKPLLTIQLFKYLDAIDIDITNDVQKRELLPRLQRWTSISSCSDASRLQVFESSFAYARSLAGGAATDIRSHPTGPEWTSYFNENPQNTIWYRMDLISTLTGAASTVTVILLEYAQVELLIVTSGGAIDTFRYTCDYFFTNTSTTSGIRTGGYDTTQSSRGGVLLNEMSHATSGTSDIVYGCTACAALSVTDKLNNADNYRCMGLTVYKGYDY